MISRDALLESIFKGHSLLFILASYLFTKATVHGCRSTVACIEYMYCWSTRLLVGTSKPRGIRIPGTIVPGYLGTTVLLNLVPL